MVDGLTLLVWDRTREKLVADMTGVAQAYHQEWTEGPLRATFEVVDGEQGADGALFGGWFSELLHCYLEATFDGVVCWGGYITEIDIETDLMRAVVSTADLICAVKCAYKDEFSGEDRYSDWRENREVRARYGYTERVIKFSGKPSAMLDENGAIKTNPDGSRYTEIDKQVEAELAYYSTPRIKDLDITEPTEAPRVGRISFAADGATALADGTLVSDGWLNDDATGVELRYAGYAYAYGFEVGSETTVGAEIARLVALSQYKGWLYPVYIADNDTMTTAGADSPMGLWTRILELARLPNQDDGYYTLTVTPDGGVEYRLMDFTPDYLVVPDKGLLRVDGQPPTWTARPGVVRIPWPGLVLPGTHMPDGLIYMERSTMAEGQPQAALSMREYTNADLRRDYEANIRRLED